MKDKELRKVLKEMGIVWCDNELGYDVVISGDNRPSVMRLEIDTLNRKYDYLDEKIMQKGDYCVYLEEKLDALLAYCNLKIDDKKFVVERAEE